MKLLTINSKLKQRYSRVATLVATICLCLNLTAGCANRTILIKSDPSGAKVIVDGVEKGITPCEFPFTYYGTRRIILEKEGYETYITLASVNPPFFHIFPFDILLLLMPYPMKDKHIFFYQLKPKESINLKEATKRGKELKEYLMRKLR